MDKHFIIDHTADYIHVTFDQPFRVLSSAVLNGGLVEASHIVNLKVPKDLPGRDALGPPAALIEQHCREKGLNGNSVGMMTAAAMDSMRTTQYRDQDVEISAIVTAGISNLRRAGDKADFYAKGEQSPAPGTINTIVVCNVSLARAAMVEVVMIAAEAKAAALQNLALLSPVSNAAATGTGTDAIAIASVCSRLKIKYAGKHTRFGELLAKSVIESTTSSVMYARHQGK